MGETAATLATVWTDISTFFTSGLSAGIKVINGRSYSYCSSRYLGSF